MQQRKSSVVIGFECHEPKKNKSQSINSFNMYKFSLPLQLNPDDTEKYGRMIELWFVFSLIWSVCASVDEDGRKKMDSFLREMDGTFPNKVLFYSTYCNLKPYKAFFLKVKKKH